MNPVDRVDGVEVIVEVMSADGNFPALITDVESQ